MFKALVGLVAVVSFALVAGGSLGRQHQSVATHARAGQAAFASLPLAFAVNRGQLDGRVSYAVQGRDASAFFTRRGVTYVLGGRHAVKVDFAGARSLVPEASAKLPGTLSYFKGKRADWLTGIPTYGQIVYRNLWPKIDLAWSGANSRLKYTLVVRPGGDPGRIQLQYRGAQLALTHGQLLVHTPMRTLREGVPVGSAPLAYTLRGGTVGFRVGAYDRSKPLVIDPPTLFYAGFLGGSGTDAGYGIAVDKHGSAYVTGQTTSTETSFPDTPGSIDNTQNGGTDAFVAKINAAGSALDYAGFLGGSGSDVGNAIAVDKNGNAYVTGSTTSDEATFPDTPGSIDNTQNGATDAFVAEINAAGSALVYAGFLGGSGTEHGYSIAVDKNANAYVTGETDSTEATFPDTPGSIDNTQNGGIDAYVAKVDAAGSALVYAGFLGGSGTDSGYGIAVDKKGNAYITGPTDSTEATFPDTSGSIDNSQNGGTDAYVAKVNAAGSSLNYAGFLGGSGTDVGYGIAVDIKGKAYVTGYTNSTQSTFPETAGATDTTQNGDYDAFVAKITNDGHSLRYATFLGGSGDDNGYAIAIDKNTKAFVTGDTNSSEATFPDTSGSFDNSDNGGTDAFVAKLNG